MTEDSKLEAVREFLAALSPSELARVIEFFRNQVGLPAPPSQVKPHITGGEELRLPGTVFTATNRS